MAQESPLLYSVDLGGSTYLARTVEGEEALSQPYRFTVSFHVAPDDPLDPDAIVGDDAALVLSRDTPLRRIACVITRASRLATRGGAAGGGQVKLTLEARLSLARFRVDIRVFREKTAPEIVAEVISAHGVAVERRLAQSYLRRPYCVQMRESDLDFAARLLEDEGIFYIVDDEGRMILGDHSAVYQEGAGDLLFVHDSGLHGQHDAVYSVGWAGRATAGKVSLRDFNPEKPRLQMDVSAPGPTAWGPEWYDYPGEYELPSQGQTKAQLRAEALACEKRRLAGRSSAPRVAPGSRFTLIDAPAGVADGEYVPTKVTHRWVREASSFSVAFEALPAETIFRPPVVTPEPTLPSPLTGFVTGPAGADIHTDAWGRAKVHFPWDRIQPKDESCSHWIPVLQDNTGRSSAMPRIGWEVLCQYLEGDPDRPVILGRVFNGADPFWEELPKRKMRMSLQSLSSPRTEDGAAAFNMVRFDDHAGFQAIDLHAQKDQNIIVANNQDEKIDSIEQRLVNGNEVVSIGANETLDVTNDHALNVDGNQKASVGGDRTAKVTGHHTDTVRLDHKLTIGGDHSRDVHVDANVAVSNHLTEIIGGSVFEISGKTNIEAAGKTSVLVAGGGIVEIAKLGKSEGTEQDRVEVVDGIAFSSAGKAHAARAEVLRSATVGGGYVVSALDEVLLAGAEKLTVNAADISLTAPVITLKVGDNKIHLESGRIDMNAPQTITFDIKGEDSLGATTSSQN